MRVTFLGALLVAAPFAAAAPAPDTYKLKLSFNPRAGTSYVVKDASTTKGTVSVTDATGAALNKQDVTTETEEAYTETVLEKGEKKPAKFKRAYEKAFRTTGGKKGAKDTRPYQGRTVVFTLKDDKYEAAVEGTPALDESALKELTDKANRSDDEDVFVPKKAVKVGETWKLDPKALAKSFEKGEDQLALDPDKSKGEGKLLKVYTKGGKQYGVIEMTFTLAIQSAGPQAARVTFDKPAVLEMKATIDAVIDGTSGAGSMTMAGKMTGQGTVAAGDQKLTVEMNLEMSGKKEQSAEKE